MFSSKIITEAEWARLTAVMAQDPSVLAAWVFGSAAAGEIRAGSDVDVGVLWRQNKLFLPWQNKLFLPWQNKLFLPWQNKLFLPWQRPSLDQLLQLQRAVQAALDFAEIDLVTLNGASSILRFEAVSGRHIYSADAGETAVFVSLTAREYEDDMVMVQRALAFST